MDYTRPQLAVIIDPIRAAFSAAKKRAVKLRYLTEISEDNASFCKELLSLVDELRHLEGIKGNFMLSESEYLAPIILFKKAKIASQIICSNQKDGFRLYKEMKKIDNKFKVCFLTASEMFYDQYRPAHSVITGENHPVIQKPIKNEELIEKINEMLGFHK